MFMEYFYFAIAGGPDNGEKRTGCPAECTRMRGRCCAYVSMNDLRGANVTDEVCMY